MKILINKYYIIIQNLFEMQMKIIYETFKKNKKKLNK